MRYMRTLQELKWVDAWADEEHPPKARARRRGIPTAWDEILINHGKPTRNWKKHRKTQWK